MINHKSFDKAVATATEGTNPLEQGKNIANILGPRSLPESEVIR